MKTLVIIPSLMHKFSFSAPLAWLFSDHIDKIKGIYSYKLDKNIIKDYNSFIVELNWFIELVEFELIVKFIKKHKPNSSIMFGGLYSQLKYKEIFERNDVDYYIKGDAELPMKMYLNGRDPRKIPNMIGRDFQNEQTYVFKEKDYKNITFNIDWIPDYLKHWEDSAKPNNKFSMSYDKLPLYPKYWEKEGEDLPEDLRWRVPFRGGRYHLPLIVTSRGYCESNHNGCDYCMGSKKKEINEIYKRTSIVMDNETMLYHLKSIDKKYNKVCLFINSDFIYDFTGYQFDLEATIEIDSTCTADQLSKILYSFKNVIVHAAIYNEGLTGKSVRNNLKEFQSLETENHKIYYFAFDKDSGIIPDNRRLYAEIVLPHWTNWNFYTNINNALKKSREWYFITGQTNLYPYPKQIVMKITRFISTRILYILNRLKIVDMRKKVV